MQQHLRGRAWGFIVIFTIFFVDYVSGYQGYKVFDGFEAFYPFYLEQHQDATCRLLHFMGTSIILLMLMVDMKIVLSLVAAGFVGAIMQSVSQLVHHGLFEMFAMIMTFLLCTKSLTGKWWKGFAILIAGYGFAWTGHFYFEHNRPATFLYPAYSLAGDFRLWFDIATKHLDPLVAHSNEEL